MPKIIDDEEVFQAVLNLLVERGYDGTTTNDMAAAANMHEATLFRKFGSKVDLIERAIKQQLSTTPLSQVSYTGDLRADLLAILEAYIATVEKYGEIMPMLLMEIPRHPELSNTLRAPMANIEGLMRIVARYQDEGRLKEESALTTVNALLAPIMVNEMYRRVDADLAMPPADPRSHIDSFLNGRQQS